MTDCLFCKIVGREIDADIVYENDDLVAFRDINPAAPTHILVVPRRHITSAQELTAADGPLLGSMFEALAEVAAGADVGGGHRIVTNVGSDAGQSVNHLHFHLLGGRSMAWPPG
jgi:histidine triad (HIT) family protein